MADAFYARAAYSRNNESSMDSHPSSGAVLAASANGTASLSKIENALGAAPGVGAVQT
jgi:hypothetical protein